MASESPTKHARTEDKPFSTPAIIKYAVEVPGKRVGRYINTPDDGTLADVLEETSIHIGSARELNPVPNVETHCFELRKNPTAVKNFKDEEEIKQVYYPEIEKLIKETCGAEHVIVFDHTVRDTSQGQKLNAAAGEAAAVVERCHTDYSDTSGPARVKTLAQSGGYTGCKLTDEEKENILSRTFCIVNVWRNIVDEPVQTKPLAVLLPSSLAKDDCVPYEMRFPERTGENYGLKYSAGHKWYYYPRMEKDECLVFKTWEKREDRPRYCFHTAFRGLDEPTEVPPRRSIEVRTVAIMPKEE